MLAKALRLDAAELTDVGRRRERNQDNIAHLIPTDQHVLDEKGALFIVCDGMGGHAAGEVASEFGVRTIAEEYYKTSGKDVITSLATAVERANTTIFKHALEHPELSGMGTTVVALVIAGGRAFVVNIGDSRAYIIRDGKMRQVTRDHSWVAEQVRVGLLTEEQARTHSHRNVITRSLGTQPNVTADLFVERMRSGDRVLLCSDGLHGFVDEGEIERVVTGDNDPQSSVQMLIDMANENGGPDNISATLVHLIDVPEAVGELTLPDSAVPAEGITQPLPAVGARASAKSASVARPDKVAQSAKVAKGRPKRRTSRRATVVTNTLRALVALLIVAVGVGFWYFAFGPYGQQQVANQQLRRDVAQAQQAIKQAPSQDPASALSALAKARDRVLSDLANPNLDPANYSTGDEMLAQQLQPAVQQTIRRYNTTALITPVGLSDAQVYHLSCQTGQGAPKSLTNVTQLAAMNPPLPAAGAAFASPRILYALSAGQLYQVLAPVDKTGLPASSAMCFQIPLNGVATVVALASDGTTLDVLAAEPNGQYVVDMVTTSGFNPDGSAKSIVASRFNVAASGEIPELIAVSGADVYISYTNTAKGLYGVWHYNSPLPGPQVGTQPPPAPKPPTGPSQTVLLQRQAVSLAFTHGVLYMLDSAGALSEINSTNNLKFSALPVQLPSPLQPAAPEDYTVATPVPTPQPTPLAGAAQSSSGAMSATAPKVAAAATATSAATATAIPMTPSVPSGTLFGKTGTLAIDPAFPTHVLICDGTQNRLVRMVASASGPGLGFAAQYAYDGLLQGATHLALSSTGTQLVVYTWAGDVLVAYVVPEAGTGA